MKGSIKFYADTPIGEKNKQFTFKVNTLSDALAAIKRFQSKGFTIRAAWHESGSRSTAGYSNKRIA